MGQLQKMVEEDCTPGKSHLVDMFRKRSQGFLLSWISKMFHFCFEVHNWWTRLLLANSRSLTCMHMSVGRWVGSSVGQSLGLYIFKRFKIKKKPFILSNYLLKILLWVNSHNRHKCLGSIH